MEEEALIRSHNFGVLHRSAMDGGVLPAKFKELMALSNAITVHCDGGKAHHVNDAIATGVSKRRNS